MKVSRVCARIEPAINEKPQSPDHVVLFCELRSAGSETHRQSSQQPPSQVSDAGEAVFFEVVEASGELVRVFVRGPGGVGIEFHFTNWQADPQIDESLFHFHAPSGVAIVNGELPDGNGGGKTLPPKRTIPPKHAFPPLSPPPPHLPPPPPPSPTTQPPLL